MQHRGIQGQTIGLFPRKLLRRLVLPLTAVWLPVLILEVVRLFQPSDVVGDSGVMWLAWITFPATVLCIVVLIVTVAIRLVRRRF